MSPSPERETLRPGERRDGGPGPGHDPILEVRIDEIRVGQRIRREMGDLKALADSIKAGGGALQPIGITPDYELVFGERRLRAYRDILGRGTIPCRVVDVPSILEGQIAENLLRKDYTVSERVAIVEALRSYEHGGDRRSDQTRDGDVEGRTVDEAAKRAGLGGKDGYFRARRVIERGVAGLVEAMDAGGISVSAAAELASRSRAEQETLLAEKTGWTVGEISDRRQEGGPIRGTPRRPGGLDAGASGRRGGRSDGGGTAGLATPLMTGEDGGMVSSSESTDPLPPGCDMQVVAPPGELAAGEDDHGGDGRLSADDFLAALIRIANRLRYLEADAGRAEWRGLARNDLLEWIDEGIGAYTRIRESISDAS